MKAEIERAERVQGSQGFTLLESLMSLLIMSFGMLALAQVMFASLGGPTLARSKTTATIVANDRLRFLAECYRRDPGGANVVLGVHGPEFAAVQNPTDGSTLNRFRVDWVVATVPDPRAWKQLRARRVTVRVSPVGTDGEANRRASLNKVVNMSAIVSARAD